MMKSIFTCGLLTAALLLATVRLAAQEFADDMPAAEPVSAEEKKVVEQEAPGDLSHLPKPLSGIRTNILDLERTGYFAIDAVDFRTRASGGEAIVWTLRVKRAVTCRHTEAMLREFRDARFYATIEKQKLEVLPTLMYYPDRISVGSSSGRLLRQDDVFELWIELPTTSLQKLISRDADRLVLRRWRY